MELRWLDAVDILLVAFLIYLLYNIVKGTVAIRIFLGIFGLYLFWKIVEALKMELLSEILGQFIGVGVIALIIVFQQEIRRFLLYLGNTRIFQDNKALRKMFGVKNKENEQLEVEMFEISEAVRNLSRTKTGALIAIRKSSILDSLVSGGLEINGDLSHSLLESVFFKNSPLHDGACIVEGSQILSAAKVLPVSENLDLPRKYGMRHRAGLGLAEQSDAVVLVISEETGEVSIAQNGKLFEVNNLTDLTANLIKRVSG